MDQYTTTRMTLVMTAFPAGVGSGSGSGCWYGSSSPSGSGRPESATGARGVIDTVAMTVRRREPEGKNGTADSPRA